MSSRWQSRVILAFWAASVGLLIYLVVTQVGPSMFLWQLALAAFVSALMILDIGIFAWLRAIRAVMYFVIVFLIIDVPLIYFSVVSSASLFTISYFYSTVLGLAWIFRRVRLLDLIRATPWAKGRLWVTAFWATLSTAMDDISRIQWYCELNEDCGKRTLPLRGASKLATILGVLACLFQEVPWRLATLENRRSHLGDL